MTDTDTLTTLKAVLKSRGLETYDEQVLQYEIKRAINEINRCRRFTPTNEKPYDKKYEDLIVPLCVSSLAKIGAEGQTSHSENGVIRAYNGGGDYPKDLLATIKPLIK